MRVQDLSIAEFKSLINNVLEEKLQEMLGDPDWGLELKDEVSKRLQRSLKQTQQGRRGIPLEEASRVD